MRFRIQGYLENARVNLEQAQMAANASELTKEIETIKQKIHDLIPLAWKHGSIAFWPEFDLLYEYYPFQTRVYRLWLEVKSRLRRNADA